MSKSQTASFGMSREPRFFSLHVYVLLIRIRPSGVSQHLSLNSTAPTAFTARAEPGRIDFAISGAGYGWSRVRSRLFTTYATECSIGSEQAAFLLLYRAERCDG
ncbi:hypothetical protein QAD02_017502 [Eretmocerus hayati]|uniref:Uncharacterized protein n=1 Tax=Eretmocerus hayati TaxID=131215 RepID=A0ACC2PE34_9HYME|nr:hypothetical protein QAD02_017502 [Eretmocerus hayati]